VERYGKEDMVVILGSPTAESAEVFARTITEGDPTWVGPLAGIALGLPVFHIVEPEVKSQIDPHVYQEQVSIMESVLDIEDVIQAVSSVRESVGV
jgi:betaine reductase